MKRIHPRASREIKSSTRYTNAANVFRVFTTCIKIKNIVKPILNNWKTIDNKCFLKYNINKTFENINDILYTSSITKIDSNLDG
jgi:hypothetical protein